MTESSVNTDTKQLQCHLIVPPSGWSSLDLKELWEYRELVFFMAWRDISSRYKQTAIGITWALVQPLASVATLSLILGKMAKLPSDGIPYPLFSFAGLLAWQYCAAVASQAIQQGLTISLFSKVYFPRIVMPLSMILPPLLDGLISLALFLITLALFGHSIRPEIVYFPIFGFILLLFALGTAAWLSALVIRFRDIKHVFPLFIQAWMFGSPLLYATSAVPQEWRLLYFMNPLAGIIDGFRWSLLGAQPLSELELGCCLLMTIISTVSGIFFYHNQSRRFTDFI